MATIREPTLGDVLTDAIRYWERRRMAYNAGIITRFIAMGMLGRAG